MRRIGNRGNGECAVIGQNARTGDRDAVANIQAVRRSGRRRDRGHVAGQGRNLLGGVVIEVHSGRRRSAAGARVGELRCRGSGGDRESAIEGRARAVDAGDRDGVAGREAVSRRRVSGDN